MRRRIVCAAAVACLAVAGAAWASIDHGTTGVAGLPSNNVVSNILQLTGNPPAASVNEHDTVQCWGSQPFANGGSRIYFTRGPSESKSICYTTPGGAAATCLPKPAGYEEWCFTHPNVVLAGPRAGWIVFQLSEGSHTEASIGIMDANGGNLDVLSDNHEPVVPPCEDPTCEPGESKPQVSPDGTRIAFRANGRLHVMTIAGDGQTVTEGGEPPTQHERPLRISGNAAGCTHHVWGDNTWVYFKAGEEDVDDEECDGEADILRTAVPATIEGAAAPTPVQLTDHDDSYCSNWPMPSPGGTRIAYHRGDGTIHLMNPDGSGDTLLVGGGAVHCCAPTSWSPNSEWLAYKWEPADDSTSESIAVARINGTYPPETHDLTQGFDDERFWFSPNSEYILFKDHEEGSGTCEDLTRDQGAGGSCYGADLLVARFGQTWAERFGAEIVQAEPVPVAAPAGLVLLAAIVAAAALLALRRPA